MRLKNKIKLFGKGIIGRNPFVRNMEVNFHLEKGDIYSFIYFSHFFFLIFSNAAAQLHSIFGRNL